MPKWYLSHHMHMAARYGYPKLFWKNHQYHTSSLCTLKRIAQDPLEELHLSFLRRTLGVGRKTSNASVRGDTGPYPLAIVVSKQVFAYTDRLEQPDRNDDDILVRHTYIEQRELNLSWFGSLHELRTNLWVTTSHERSFLSQLRTALRTAFIIR